MLVVAVLPVMISRDDKCGQAARIQQGEKIPELLRFAVLREVARNEGESGL